METDIREVLPTISVPTLMMYQDRYREGCLYLAERIPDAEVLEVTSPDTSIYADSGVADAVERFLSEGRIDTAPERVLTTVLFTDIVESTSRAAELGDSRWRALLDAHHTTVRAQLARYGGREVRGTGDGFLATFDGPARAIACAHGAINAVGELGLEIRAGVHTGEVELVGRQGGGHRGPHRRPDRRRRRARARCWSRASSGTSRPARASSSRTAAPGH